MAESWEVSDDFTTMTVHLREGVRWSDGELVTTEDVAFWWNDVMLNESLTAKIPNYFAPGGNVMKVNIIDDYTFFTFFGFLGKATPNFLLALVLMWMGYVYFDLNMGGLFSAEYQRTPWSLAKVGDLIGHLWVPLVVLGTAGTADLIRVLRANPARRVGQALRHRRPRQGTHRVEADRQVPGAHRHQPVREQHRQCAAGADLGRRHRVGGAETCPPPGR